MSSSDPTINISEISDLLKNVATEGSKLTSGDVTARRAALDAARELYLKLETPMETIIRWEWAEPSLNAALRIGVEVKLFEALAADGAKPKTSEELASATGMDPNLLSRLLRHMAAMRAIHEVDVNTYTSNTISEKLIDPMYRDGISFFFDVPIVAVNHLPKFLSSTNYTNPSDPNHTAFKLGHKTDKHFFEWFATNPEHALRFNNHMKGKQQGRAKWTDPGAGVDVPGLLGVESKTREGEGEKNGDDEVLLVDIGGGVGQDIVEFYKDYAHLPGRLILQDLPDVAKEAATAQLPERIEIMSHDFFTEQPVRGAHAYYMHCILHDWPASSCVQILRALKPAMSRTSRILLNEFIMPERAADWEASAIDIVMMSMFASCERTESQWRELVQQAGLRVESVVRGERGSEGLVVCVLP